jgi:hypothetical protein
MNTERIIDKIKKLIRHERSARKCSTQAEAEAFAAKIHALLIEHKISMSEVLVDNESEQQRVGEEELPIGKKLRYGRGYVPLEDNRLMNIVAAAHFCQAILFGGTNIILLVGAEDDRSVAAEMFRFLSSTMKRVARLEEEKTRRARRSVRRFKPHFYLGFTIAIRRRYEKMRETNECTALVRADGLVKRYIEENHETESVRPRTQKRINKNAYFRGVEAGCRVDLKSQVLGGSDEVHSYLP